jgi:CheY-like chemotaxis protein
MTLEIESFAEDFDPRFKIFHELMARKVRDILLVSTPYDAWILEEDCRLSERIIHEYRGLNLSNPPRFTWVSTAQEALAMLNLKKFDMVISMSQLADMDAFTLGEEIKKRSPICRLFCWRMILCRPPPSNACWILPARLLLIDVLSGPATPIFWWPWSKAQKTVSMSSTIPNLPASG